MGLLGPDQAWSDLASSASISCGVRSGRTVCVLAMVSAAAHARIWPHRAARTPEHGMAEGGEHGVACSGHVPDRRGRDHRVTMPKRC